MSKTSTSTATRTSSAPSTIQDGRVDGNANANGAVLVHDMKPMGLGHLERPPLSILMALYDMFNKIDRRDPPPSTSSNKKTHQHHHHLRLITIRVSHYNEKARWALDYLEEEEHGYYDDNSPSYYYTEDCHPPGFQALESIRASQGRASVTPMVIDSAKHHQVWIKSDEILRHYCPHLYPKPHRATIEELEDDFGRRLGPAVRTFAYGDLLQKKYWPEMVQMNTGPECAAIENLLFPYMQSMIGPALRKSLQITPASVALSKTTIEQVFADVEQQLQHNSNVGNGNGDDDCYLVGDTFTAADLTFAALAGPLLRPPELQIFQAPLDDLPDSTIAFMQQLQASKAGQHALKVFRFHRYPSSQVSTLGRVVQIKCAGRNRVVPWMAMAGVMTGVAAATAAAAAVGYHQAMR
jgi:glutathione S-transferase